MIALWTWLLGLFGHSAREERPAPARVVSRLADEDTQPLRPLLLVDGYAFSVECSEDRLLELQMRANACLVLRAVGLRVRGHRPNGGDACAPN
jgi:hypothetical protein